MLLPCLLIYIHDIQYTSQYMNFVKYAPSPCSLNSVQNNHVNHLEAIIVTDFKELLVSQELRDEVSPAPRHE